MTDQTPSNLPTHVEDAMLSDLREQVRQLREHVDERERSAVSMADVERLLRRVVAEAVDRDRGDTSPQTAADVRLQVRHEPAGPAALILKRLRIAMYGLAALGFTSIVGGSFIASLTGTTVTLGILASSMAGLTGCAGGPRASACDRAGGIRQARNVAGWPRLQHTTHTTG